MNVPRFPSPPLAIVDVTSFNNIKKYNQTSLNRNFTFTLTRKKKHVHRISRYRRFSRLKNSVHPRQIITKSPSQTNNLRIIQFNLQMTEQQVDDVDDVDVVCAANTEISSVTPGSAPLTSITGESWNKFNNIDQLNYNTNVPQHPIINKSIGIQTHQCDKVYMLRVLPTLNNINDVNSNNDSKIMSRVRKNFGFICRLCLCQLGLAWLLTFWTVAGAAAFHATEGPRERAQVFELRGMQRDLAIGLATELRQLKTNEEEIEPHWSNKVKQYVSKHEKLLLAAVNAGYGEGGDITTGDTASGQLWSFSGCLLFTISLITTLGFGAPVPRTTSGRTVAVIFAALGIPAHFLLVFNLGLLLAMHLQKFAIRKKYGPNCGIAYSEALHNKPVPKWIKIIPFIFIVIYYSVGIIGFGVARSRPFAASILFPLDFTAAGGLASTSAIVRIIYGLYLEGAVTIAAMTVAILRVSANDSLTNIGLKYGLLTEI